MKQKKNNKELDVDSIGNQESLSKEEEKMISEFLRKRKSIRRKLKIKREKINE